MESKSKMSGRNFYEDLTLPSSGFVLNDIHKLGTVLIEEENKITVKDSNWSIIITVHLHFQIVLISS